jgi:folate-binding protein YgfZ
MNEDYQKIREENAPAFYKQKRGLIYAWGKEAVQFLNGLISNDVAKLEDGAQMMAAFPNVQGRLLAIVRVLRRGDKFLFETDEATREKVFQNLFRFTFAGDFFVEDISENYQYFEIFNSDFGLPGGEVISFTSKNSNDCFVSNDIAEIFESDMRGSGAIEISDDLYEILRIENGDPKYGVDMDETTVVLETGLNSAVSFTKGCYVGQEIIARIHFRGHVAKKLTGLLFADNAEVNPNDELRSPEGKPAGRITSAAYSPKLQKTVALAYVRYEFLAEGTELQAGDLTAKVTNFPVL